MWQLYNFVESSLGCLGKLATFRGYLILLLTILFGHYIWKNVFSDWWRRTARVIKFASTLPGPPTVPIIGNALEFACKMEDTLSRVADVGFRYPSPFRVWLGPKLYIVTTEPRDYEAILGSPNATNKDTVYRVMEPLIGQGILSASGPNQKARKKLIFPILNSDEFLGIHLKYFALHSRICTDLLEKRVGQGEFNVMPYLTHLTIDIILDTVLGLPGTTQKDGHKDLVYWTERMYGLIHSRMVKIWLHYDKLFFLTKLGKEHNKGVETIHGFVENAIARKKRELSAYEKEEGDLGKPRVTLLEKLIAHTSRFNDLDDIALRDEVYTIFAASQDTIALIVAFALLMLSMHPDIQDKVRDEINTVLGDEAIDVNRLSRLKYLEMVLRETIRLFPIGPLLVRQLKGDVALDSCTLPDGCAVVMIPFVTHRSPKYWEEPEKFIPERFLPENSLGRHRYASALFSGGSRSCIGQKFALMCMKTIMASIVGRYRLSSTQKLQDLRLKMDLSVRSRDGYKISITKVH